MTVSDNGKPPPLIAYLLAALAIVIFSAGAVYGCVEMNRARECVTRGGTLIPDRPWTCLIIIDKRA